MKNNTYTLTPQPKYGIVDVLTKPSRANILLNGKKVGTSPSILQKIPIGDCSTMTLEKEGWLKVNKPIKITEDTTTKVNEILKNTLTVNFTTEPNGAACWVNNDKKGKTPLNISVILGNNKVRFEKEGYTTFEKNININEGNTNLMFKLEADEIARLRKSLSNRKVLMYTSYILSAGSFVAAYVFKTQAENLYAGYEKATTDATSKYAKAQTAQKIEIASLAAGSAFALTGIYATISVVVKKHKIKAYSFVSPFGVQSVKLSYNF